MELLKHGFWTTQACQGRPCQWHAFACLLDTDCFAITLDASSFNTDSFSCTWFSLMICRGASVVLRSACITRCVQSVKADLSNVRGSPALPLLSAAARASSNSSMAPKRKQPEAGNDAPAASKVPSKKLNTDVEFDDRWKQEKPSLLYLGDDLDSSKKIAAFDFDNTLVEWLEGVPAFSPAPDSWEFWSDEVPKKLKVCA